MKPTFVHGNKSVRRLKSRSSDQTLGKGSSLRELAGHWNRFPRKVVMASSLSEFKEYLDDALSHVGLF